MNVVTAAASLWLFNFVVAQAVPHILKMVESHGYGMYFIFGRLSFSMFFFVHILIPDTKDLSLERMDDLFGVTEIAKQMLDEERHTYPAATTTEKQVSELEGAGLQDDKTDVASNRAC